MVKYQPDTGVIITFRTNNNPNSYLGNSSIYQHLYHSNSIPVMIQIWIVKSDSGDIGDNVFEHAGHSDICGYVDGNYIGTLLFDVDV